MDAISLVLPTMRHLTDAAQHMRKKENIAALSKLIEAQQNLGILYVILHQQGDGTYNGLESARPIGNL